MKFHEFGSKKNPHIMLIHGGGKRMVELSASGAGVIGSLSCDTSDSGRTRGKNMPSLTNPRRILRIS